MPMARPWRTRVGVGILTTAAVATAGTVDFNEHAWLQQVSCICTGVIRSSRAVYAFTANTLDYEISLRGYDYKSDEYMKARSQVHQRAAKRLLSLCELNKGFYVKAGQFLASIQHIPKEYSSVLSTLQDKATPCPFREIKKMLETNFHKDISDIYVSFEESPIAAASIAQVHCARLANDEKVAVKVQYPGLEQHLKIDISTMQFLSKAISLIFPGYQFDWLVSDFERTLLNELDFLLEAKNAERTSKIFSKKPVKVPRIHWEFCTQQVLTMEFVHGCKVDDLQSLMNLGISPNKVVQVLVETFAEMIFVHGFVHGDPHPGNILVSSNPNNKFGFSLVLLDHGIYKELDESFRLDFCELWKALIIHNWYEIQKIGEKIGAGKYYPFLPVIFTGRTLESKADLGMRMSLEERKRLNQELKQITMGDFSQFMENLPRDLLIVLRTDGLIRGISSKLGASQHMRIFANAKYAIAGLKRKHDRERERSWMVVLENVVSLIWLRIFVDVLELQYNIKRIYSSFLQRIRLWLSKFSTHVAWGM